MTATAYTIPVMCNPGTKEDGDKRFKIEIVADEVGPALRYATVDVHRIVRPAAEPGTGSFSEDGVGA